MSQRVILANDVARLETADGGVHREYGGFFPGRVFDVDDKMAKLVEGVGGYVVGIGTHRRRRHIGFRCPGCGFGSYTRRCSRCGKECERE